MDVGNESDREYVEDDENENDENVEDFGNNNNETESDDSEDDFANEDAELELLQVHRSQKGTGL